MSIHPCAGKSRWLLAGGCALGLSLVALAPFAAHRGLATADLLYRAFDPVCHQLAARSFHLWGEPLAVCHRCTGLYLGFLLGVVLWPRLARAGRRLLAAPRWILLFFAPMAIDVALLGNVPASRFLTGLLAAFPVALLALAALAQLVPGRSPICEGRS